MFLPYERAACPFYIMPTNDDKDTTKYYFKHFDSYIIVDNQ